MKTLLAAITVLSVVSCTHSRLARYQDLLDNELGSANKRKIASILGGEPAGCEKVTASERCEYRTSAGKNKAVPSVHAKAPGMGPDISPYEHYDVIHVFYNDLGVMREWQPIVLE